MLYAINDIIQAVVVVKINKYTRYFHPPASFVNTIEAAKKADKSLQIL